MALRKHPNLLITEVRNLRLRLTPQTPSNNTQYYDPPFLVTIFYLSNNILQILKCVIQILGV